MLFIQRDRESTREIAAYLLPSETGFYANCSNWTEEPIVNRSTRIEYRVYSLPQLKQS